METQQNEAGGQVGPMAGGACRTRLEKAKRTLPNTRVGRRRRALEAGVLRETKAGVGKPRKGRARLNRAAPGGTGMAFNKPSRARWQATDMAMLGQWGGGVVFQSWGSADNPTWKALPRGLRGQQKKPKHPSLQRWFWKAKPLSPPSTAHLCPPRSPPMLSNL